MEKGNIRLHTEATPLNCMITKKFVTGNYVGDPYSCAELSAHTFTGGFWAHG